MKYWYYVSYSFMDENGRAGFGGATITRNSPIDSDIAVREIRSAITSDQNLRSVVLISWNLLRTEV